VYWLDILGMSWTCAFRPFVKYAENNNMAKLWKNCEKNSMGKVWKSFEKNSLKKMWKK
jgi:hypothetical protein